MATFEQTLRSARQSAARNMVPYGMAQSRNNQWWTAKLTYFLAGEGVKYSKNLHKVNPDGTWTKVAGLTRVEAREQIARARPLAAIKEEFQTLNRKGIAVFYDCEDREPGWYYELTDTSFVDGPWPSRDEAFNEAKIQLMRSGQE